MSMNLSTTWLFVLKIVRVISKDIINTPHCQLLLFLWGISGALKWRHKSPASRLLTQSFIQTQIKENIKALRHWPLCGEFTGDRWIPRTNGQSRGKCFHLMTSSWIIHKQQSIHKVFPCHDIIILLFENIFSMWNIILGFGSTFSIKHHNLIESDPV